MYSIMDLCILCTKDYNCVSVDERIMSQVEYLLPEITIIKLGVPLRICSACDGALCDFSKFKQSSVESSRRLEASIKGAQGPALHTGSFSVVDDNETSVDQPEKMEEIFIKEENLEEIPLDTQMHTDRAFLNPMALVETIISEPKDRVSQNMQLHTDTNTDNIEEFFIKKEQIEETPQNRELYFNTVKEEYVNNSMNDDIGSQPKHNTEDESATFIKSEEVWEGSSADFTEETDGNCNKNFQNSTKNIIHKTENQEMKNKTQIKKEFSCDVCEKSFTLKKHLTYHMKIHSGLLEFRCEVCNKSFTLKNTLNTHMKIHSEKEFQCEVCFKSFTLKSTLNCHMKIHSGVKDFRCDICEKLFTEKVSLTRHMKIHSGVKDFLCMICGKSFAHRFTFNCHIKIHSGVKDYRCDICNKLFKQKSHLNSHLKMHSGVKDFRCDVCGKLFTEKSTLKYHMRIHSGVKEFQCVVCEKSFTQKGNLINHMKFHSGVKDFRCDVCDKSFTLKNNLTRHMKIHSVVK